MPADLITHCLTIGRRPDLLRQTLDSMGPLRALPALAINDFGDAETSAVFTELCPNGRIVGPGHHLGHHPAIDAMYGHVTTPFIFHNEDDWQFNRLDFLADALTLLQADPAISMVCVRNSGDIPMPDKDRKKITVETAAGIRFERLDHTHDQWYGFSFNPHLVAKSLWQGLGGYSGFERERHISRHLKRQGRYVAYLLPPACHHIGEGRSAFSGKISRFKAFKNWLRGVNRA